MIWKIVFEFFIYFIAGFIIMAINIGLGFSFRPTLKIGMLISFAINIIIWFIAFKFINVVGGSVPLRGILTFVAINLSSVFWYSLKYYVNTQIVE
ncbi:MAG: hypothetical protein IJS60_06950 [Abditibacteriota bacterium]|nr:hypothetical protein [Abditibacteriota bacterium]